MYIVVRILYNKAR